MPWIIRWSVREVAGVPAIRGERTDVDADRNPRAVGVFVGFLRSCRGLYQSRHWDFGFQSGLFHGGRSNPTSSSGRGWRNFRL